MTSPEFRPSTKPLKNSPPLPRAAMAELAKEDRSAIAQLLNSEDDSSLSDVEKMMVSPEISELFEMDQTYLDLGLSKLVRFYEQKKVESHPYVQWLNSRPVDLSSVWLLFHNLEPVTGSIVHWLSTTLARLNDPVVSCLLVEQLYDELGNGKPDQVHKVLFERLYQALHPWQPEAVRTGKIDVFTASIPGLKLKQGFESYYTARNPLLAVGSLLSGEICAYKLDQCIYGQIARTQALSAYDLTWLTMHLTVEAEHASASTILAHRLDQLDVPRKRVGLMAQAVWEIFMQFLDEVYALNLKILDL